VVVVVAVALALWIVAPRLHGGDSTTLRPTASLLTATRDLARFETLELNVEKVIDLTDRQSRLFGLIEAKDAILLVSAGVVVLGIDLSKLSEGAAVLDPATHVATFSLAEPEVLSARLDENRTYVYTRATDLLARRDEHLEGRARQEAIAAIERTAREGDAPTRARANAERLLTALAKDLGATQVRFVWRRPG
jgi:hypothetical protein